jgi:hypothetical protein
MLHRVMTLTPKSRETFFSRNNLWSDGFPGRLLPPATAVSVNLGLGYESSSNSDSSGDSQSLHPPKRSKDVEEYVPNPQIQDHDAVPTEETIIIHPATRAQGNTITSPATPTQANAIPQRAASAVQKIAAGSRDAPKKGPRVLPPGYQSKTGTDVHAEQGPSHRQPRPLRDRDLSPPKKNALKNLLKDRRR